MARRILAITGGIGGAKLARGLAEVLDVEEVLFAVNTGDDFEHLGLHISPDVDTLCYTLADMSNKELGWGRADETWNFMTAMRQLGGEDWFNLGDRDLALHHARSQMLADGASLNEVTDYIRQAFDIAHRIAPMSDDPVRTVVHTNKGSLAFQHYFVRDKCAPTVTGFDFSGIEEAKPNPMILDWLTSSTGVIICPSNPFVSVDPLLKLTGMTEALKSSPGPVIAVSPIVGGLAIKGPTAKMMDELKIPATAEQVAEHYSNLLEGFLLDEVDHALHGRLDIPTTVAPSVMHSLQDRIDLALACLAFIDELRS